MNVAVVASLRHKHSEYLKQAADALLKAADIPDHAEKKAWREVGQSWRELARQSELIISRFAQADSA